MDKTKNQIQNKTYEWLTIKEYCSLTGKGKRTIYRYRKENKIISKVEKHILYIAVESGKPIVNKDNKFVIFSPQKQTLT